MREWPQKLFHDQSLWMYVARPEDRTSDLLNTRSSQTAHPTDLAGPAKYWNELYAYQKEQRRNRQSPTVTSYCVLSLVIYHNVLRKPGIQNEIFSEAAGIFPLIICWVSCMWIYFQLYFHLFSVNFSPNISIVKLPKYGYSCKIKLHTIHQLLKVFC